MRARGIDTSVYDGAVDWVKVKAAGYSFMFTKASQIAADTTYITNMTKAKAAGLLRGAYHYFDFRYSETAQANLFVNTIRNDYGELPLMVDVEQDVRQYGMAIDKNVLANKLWTFINAVQAQLPNAKIGIYTGFYYWLDFIAPNPKWANYPLWMAWWPMIISGAPDESKVRIPAPWVSKEFWQWSADGSVSGVQALDVDKNLYSGTEEELRAKYAPAPIVLTLEQRVKRIEDYLKI